MVEKSTMTRLSLCLCTFFSCPPKKCMEDVKMKAPHTRDTTRLVNGTILKL